MIRNKKKFTSGMKKVLFAFTLAFLGPVCFVLGSGHDDSNNMNIILIIIGVVSMMGCLIIGIIGIRTILDSFFEETNE